MHISLRSLLLGGAAVCASIVASGAAQAQTDNFNGGGSSLAAKVYIAAGGLYATGTPNFNLTYGTSSSGTGRSAFISNNLSLDYAGLTPPPGQVQFAASDAFASSTDITNINASLGSGVPMIQIPMFATAIAIPVNLPAPFNTDGSVAFTDNDLGLIFSGQVQNYADARLSANQPSVTLPAQAITVVYRSDGSGTSNLFTTHLGNVLTPQPSGASTGHFYGAFFGNSPSYPQITANAVVPAIPVTGTSTFASVFNPQLPPNNFVGQAGSGAVQNYINNTVGAIGYLSPDYTDIAPINVGAAGFPSVASVNGKLPDAPSTAAAFGGLTVPTTAAQLANQQNFAPLIPNPGSGYPIVGYTYWFLSQCYSSTSPAQGTDIKGFLTTYFTNGTYPGLINFNGFASLAAANYGPILNYLVNNRPIGGVAPNLNIQNPTVCTAGKGRGA